MEKGNLVGAERESFASDVRKMITMHSRKDLEVIDALTDALTDALHEAGHACCCEKPHSSAGVSLHEADCWTAKARAALALARSAP